MSNCLSAVFTENMLQAVLTDELLCCTDALQFPSSRKNHDIENKHTMQKKKPVQIFQLLHIY